MFFWVAIFIIGAITGEITRVRKRLTKCRESMSDLAYFVIKIPGGLDLNPYPSLQDSFSLFWWIYMLWAALIAPRYDCERSASEFRARSSRRLAGFKPVCLWYQSCAMTVCSLWVQNRRSHQSECMKTMLSIQQHAFVWLITKLESARARPNLIFPLVLWGDRGQAIREFFLN